MAFAANVATLADQITAAQFVTERIPVAIDVSPLKELFMRRIYCCLL